MVVGNIVGNKRNIDRDIRGLKMGGRGSLRAHASGSAFFAASHNFGASGSGVTDYGQD